MELFIAGFVCAVISIGIGIGIGWFAHDRFVHKPLMRQTNAQARKVIEEVRAEQRARENEGQS